MKVLVTGGRTYLNQNRVFETLSRLHTEHVVSHVIHGGAKGADTLAGAWARLNGVQEVRCDANWEIHGKAGGSIRNRRMLELLDYEDDLVVAFDGGKGTANMVSLAESQGRGVLYCQSTL